MTAVPFSTDADAVAYPECFMAELVALRREAERLMRSLPIDPDVYATAVKVCTRVDTELRDREWDSMRVMLQTEADHTWAIVNADRYGPPIRPGIVEERDNATLAIDAVVKAIDAINRRRIIR